MVAYTHIVMSAYEGVMMKEWKGTIEVWGSSLNVLITFISFHLGRVSLATRSDIT